ncbi:MAG: tryptophan synthase subunit alpha [Candidatus Methanomethylophilaceae archaeon]|nr:tryptophan synthase subunit alpha [Candidatus Methanomethylophilaceae archaeon]
MSDIGGAFKGRKALVAFLTCGDPDLDTTAEIVRSMASNGVDLVELGIPFSDPTAEGPVIQAANVRALKAGTTTDKVFDMAESLRGEIDIPLAFMTYANVVFSYGTERFLSRCEMAGIRGLILPDVPYEEKEDFEPACRRHGVALISMVAPTSHDRIRMIAKESEGFLYVVSSMGVTGTRSKITTDISPMIEAIRESTETPCAVGFGISTPEQARDMSRLADGVIVGSAIVKIVAKNGRDSAGPVGEFVRSLKDAMLERLE